MEQADPGGRCQTTSVDSPRSTSAARHLESERGQKVLAALDDVAAHHAADPATVALAWLLAQPTVAAPIASARTAAQLPALLASVDLHLTQPELDLLTSASA